MSRLDLVVGCNGAGKSTFVRLVLQPVLTASEFVNADLIAARLWPDDQEVHAYDAAALAAATRAELIERRRSFIAETVFSHPSKLDLIEAAKNAGYDLALHVLLVPEDLTVHRVAARVAAGGHRVPEDKIRSRYRRLWALVARATLACDSARMWDNCRHDGPRLVAVFVGGMPVGAPDWPAWTPPELALRWPS